ncbi:hypothetical protein SKAU_G00290640 [Synaphobranchus kaupii]|uniref:Uncharacterized protein n=1 Tax=Synaphobranchus kaupii TaxID=118154 RepID=A0A9Q1ETM8_SYNKA|nr:hypothetical protein SKAU_G00290640 [Synaphobranchus kaupii]
MNLDSIFHQAASVNRRKQCWQWRHGGGSSAIGRRPSPSGPPGGGDEAGALLSGDSPDAVRRHSSNNDAIKAAAPEWENCLWTVEKLVLAVDALNSSNRRREGVSVR